MVVFVWINTYFWSFLDEAIVAVAFLFFLRRLIYSSKLPKDIRRVVFIISIYAILMFMYYIFMSKHAGLNTITGFYDLWRGHLAILIGIVFSNVASIRIKTKVLHGIKIFITLNVVFSIIQSIAPDLLIHNFLNYTIEYRSGIPRSYGFFSHPNINAWFIGLNVLILTFQGKIRSILFTLSIFALFTTGSRVVLLLVLILVVINVARPYHRNLRNSYAEILVKGVLFSLVLLSFLLLQNQSVNSTATGYSFLPKIETITTLDENSPGASYLRALALVKTWRRFVEAPIFGLGFGTYGTPSSVRSYSPYLIEDGWAPKIATGMTQIDLLIPLLLPESGIVGLLLWVWTMFLLIRWLFRETKDQAPYKKAFYYWFLIMLVSTLIGPGITHPLIVVFTIIGCMMAFDVRCKIYRSIKS